MASSPTSVDQEILAKGVTSSCWSSLNGESRSQPRVHCQNCCPTSLSGAAVSQGSQWRRGHDYPLREWERQRPESLQRRPRERSQTNVCALEGVGITLSRRRNDRAWLKGPAEPGCLGGDTDSDLGSSEISETTGSGRFQAPNTPRARWQWQVAQRFLPGQANGTKGRSKDRGLAGEVEETAGSKARERRPRTGG